MSTRDELGPVSGLGAAFLARDLAAALDWFVPDDDIGYVGSEEGESADGRVEVTRLLAALFARPVVYGWSLKDAVVHNRAGVAYVVADAVGEQHGPAGFETYPYRVSGLVEPVGARWRWRVCQGSEPTPASDPAA